MYKKFSFLLVVSVFAINADSSDNSLGLGNKVLVALENVKKAMQKAKTTVLENQSSHPIQSPYCESEVVYFGEPADFSWVAKAAEKAVENAPKNIDAYNKRNPFYDTECIDVYAASAAGQDSQAAWYEKVWNAEIAGYQGAGKYVIIGSAVAIASVVAAYYAGLFGSKASLDQKVEALILQAQDNPNIVIVELPKILEACQNDQERFELITLVLENVEITPEIQEAFGL